MDQGAFNFLDSALSAGESLDWITPTISLINYTVGSHVGYGVWADAVSSKYAMSLGDLRRVLRKHGIDFCCSSLIDGAYMFDVPIEQKRWAEWVMDKYGVIWNGGYTSWADWLRGQLGAGRARPYEDGAGFGAGALAPAF